MSTTKTNYGALSILTTVFFFWGFIAAGNNIFIPFCKSYFQLDQFQSQLIDFSFYGAYYLGALSLFIFGSSKGKDIIASMGYKKSIVYGLLLSALGAGAMILSVYLNMFAGMLAGLFVVALGFSIQQTSANPFMILLGEEKTGSSRINLGGAVNSLGTTIGPLVVSLALFGTAAAVKEDAIQSLSLTKVMILYAFVGALFISIAALFGFSKSVPSGKLNDKNAEIDGNEEQLLDSETTFDESSTYESPTKTIKLLLIMTGLLIVCFSPVFYSYKESLNWTESQKEWIRVAGWACGMFVIIFSLLYGHFKGAKVKTGWGAMQFPQLTLGMIAIFVYVGVEVAVGSNLSELLKLESFGSISSSESAPYIAMFWGSLMIGRWSGAIKAFNLSDKLNFILKMIVPIVAFIIILLSTYLSGYSIEMLYWYIICVVVQVLASFLTKDKPAETLAVFGFLGMLAILIGIFSSGTIAIYAFLSSGLFCSIMWPCIFSLSLAGLGKYQSQGSAFLVMMILGGAVIPPLQGLFADLIGIQESFFIGMLCFLFLLYFAISVRKMLIKQKIEF